MRSTVHRCLGCTEHIHFIIWVFLWPLLRSLVKTYVTFSASNHIYPSILPLLKLSQLFCLASRTVPPCHFTTKYFIFWNPLFNPSMSRSRPLSYLFSPLNDSLARRRIKWTNMWNVPVPAAVAFMASVCIQVEMTFKPSTHREEQALGAFTFVSFCVCALL